MKEQAKQLRYDKAYLRMAQTWSELSHCKRKSVGAIIVKDGMIISDGYNGTPSGFDNCCENEDGEIILSFRKIFEEDPKTPAHFLSIRGVGYRFMS